MKKIDQLRNFLSAGFVVLKTLHQCVSAFPLDFRQDDLEEPSAFDDIDDEVESSTSPSDTAAHTMAFAAADESTIEAMVPLHSRRIPMPSTCTQFHADHGKIELTLRQEQAVRHLTALRSVIAEKSFQYSHILHPAGRKTI